MRAYRRRFDDEEFPLPGIDPIRSIGIEMQLVVLRRLQNIEKTIRQ